MLKPRKYNLVLLASSKIRACFDMPIDVNKQDMVDIIHALDNGLGRLMAAGEIGSSYVLYGGEEFKPTSINKHVIRHDLTEEQYRDKHYGQWLSQHLPVFIKKAKERGIATLEHVFEGKITPAEFVSQPSSVDQVMWRGNWWPLDATKDKFVIHPMVACKVCKVPITGTCIVNFNEDGTISSTQVFVPDDKGAAPMRKRSKHWLCSEHAVRDVTGELKGQYEEGKEVEKEEVEPVGKEDAGEAALAIIKEAAERQIRNMYIMLRGYFTDNFENMDEELAISYIRTIKDIKKGVQS